jgi:cytochrome c oxidase assembly protein subunit 11
MHYFKVAFTSAEFLQLKTRIRYGGKRFSTNFQSEDTKQRNKKLAIYGFAGVVFFVGLSYASVPLYQMFCQVTGLGGTTQLVNLEKFKDMKPVKGAKPIKVEFYGEVFSGMPWTFIPQQKSVKVVPGETALAFYTAYNPTDKAVTGVSTYNVSPQKVGKYFHKIQCFCFDEQRLRPNEEIDMPVFFYIDPEFLNDPQMDGVSNIILNYTFFRTGDMEPLPAEIEALQREAIKKAEQEGGHRTVGAGFDSSYYVKKAADILNNPTIRNKA